MIKLIHNVLNFFKFALLSGYFNQRFLPVNKAKIQFGVFYGLNKDIQSYTKKNNRKPTTDDILKPYKESKYFFKVFKKVDVTYDLMYKMVNNILWERKQK